MSQFKIECPHCTQHLLADELAIGQMLHCPSCKTGITVKKPDEPIVASKEEEKYEGTLHFIEVSLLKMLKGILRFIFMLLPSLIGRAFLKLCPWAARYFNVAFLMVAWLLTVCWPLVLFLLIPKLFMSLSETVLATLPKGVVNAVAQLIQFVQTHIVLVNVVTYGWIILALIGSAWGFLYIRLKHRKMKAVGDQRQA